MTYQSLEKGTLEANASIISASKSNKKQLGIVFLFLFTLTI